MNLFKSFLLLSIALLTLAACQPVAEEADVANLPMAVSGEEAAPEMVVEEPAEADVTFALTGEDFKFLLDGTEAPELRVKKGDTVRIELESTDGFHDWVVDEFDAATEQVKTGNSTSVTFVADEAGTFEYYCSVGQHRANGMFGKLIVE